MLQPLQQGDKPLRQAGQTDHGEGAGHQIVIAAVETVVATLLLQPEWQMQVIQAGMLLPQMDKLTLTFTGQTGKR